MSDIIIISIAQIQCLVKAMCYKQQWPSSMSVALILSTKPLLFSDESCSVGVETVNSKHILDVRNTGST